MFLKHKIYRKSLINDVTGVTAVEFALIAPTFILMIAAIIEFSLIMYVSGVMEGAITASSRFGKTGYVAAGSTRQEQIIASVASRSSGLLDAQSIKVNTKVYPSFDSISQEEPFIDTNKNGVRDVGEVFTDVNGNGNWDSAGVVGLGNANDIVLYTIYYPWVIHTPIIANFFGGTLWLSSRTVVKNEPY